MSALIQAQQALARGDFGAARQLLTGYVKLRSNDLDALYLLGVCEQSAQQTDAAKSLYQRVLKKAPQHFGAHYNLAMLLSSSGDDQNAMTHHDAAIRLQPGQYWAYVNRGNAHARLENFSKAISDYRHALTLDGNVPEVWTNLGNVLREAGQFEEGLTCHDKALELRPSYPEALSNKAICLAKLKRLDEALSHLDTALNLDAHYQAAWTNRGDVLRQMRRFDEALQSFDKSFQISEHDPNAWVNLGSTYDDLHRDKAALECYARALALRPTHADTWLKQGAVHRRGRQFAAAAIDFAKAEEYKPHIDFALGASLACRLHECQWTEFAQDINNVATRLKAGELACTPLDIAVLFDDPSLQFQFAKLFASNVHPDDPCLPAFETPLKPGKIRIGYYSADFQSHPVALLLVELLERHNRNQFELIGFSMGEPSNAPIRQRLINAFDQFFDVRLLSDRQIAEQSRELHIDIAVNLGGYTAGGRNDIFAMRAAPVQVNYLGYPGTLGADYIDYLLTDSIVCPPGSEPHYSEQLVRLPNCFMPHDSTRQIANSGITRADQALPETGFVFCCFNNHLKINPQVFDIWMRLLKQVEGSVLWLSSASPSIQANLADRAQLLGVNPSRLIYAQHLPDVASHLARCQLADLFLDTLPYNAHATAMDALWAGLPVLTCKGQTFASRVAASLLTNIGMPELVTNSLMEYEMLALELANQPLKLASIRKTLAMNRNTMPLFDTQRLATSIESAFTKMFEHHLAGHSPQTFHC